ncbi:ABC transporter ATP-binding protein [Candidatus Pacearchaeota archaeon]|nr:ABC transporter ATP-binding protein [Candidatus Pacearchaeota archaeon]
MNKKIVLSVIDLKKIYDLGEVKVNALNGVTFDILRNKITTIIGPSGSGKSTLLHLLGFLDKPTSGKIFLDDKDVSKLNEEKLADLRNKKIGFIFQFFNLYPMFNAVENVELPLSISHVDEKERRKKALELLKLVGLEERAYHFPKQLSGGEQQRVAIARALANNPSIIMADEPTGNLDTQTSHEIMELLVKLKEHTTVIIITHDLGLTKHSDKIIKIVDGKISEMK